MSVHVPINPMAHDLEAVFHMRIEAGMAKIYLALALDSQELGDSGCLKNSDSSVTFC
jgi:hypothetical protein